MEKFLKAGDRVKLVVKFQGRQITKKEFGENVMNLAIKSLAEVSTVVEEPKYLGKLLIAQVLGRGLRIPNGYPNAEVTVFNHDKWSEKIKDLVEEILEMETKIKNSPILNGDRVNFHFLLHNLDYTKEKKDELCRYRYSKEFSYCNNH